MKFTKSPALFLLGLSFALTSCNKDKPDFTKYDEFTVSPLIVAKIIETDITLENLADSVDAMDADSNGLFSISYGQDTLFSQRIDSLLPPVSQSGSSLSVQLDGFDAGTATVNQTVALYDFFPSLSQDVADSLRVRHGRVDYFPEIQPTSGGTFSASAGSDFNYLNLSSGDMKLVMENQWTIDMNNIQLDVRNASNGFVLGSYTFLALQPGEKDSLVVSLAGKTLENNLEIVFLNVESPGSGTDPLDSASHVFIDSNMAILTTFELSNLTVTDGEVVIPNEILPAEEFPVVIDVNNGVELALVEFASGTFDISVDRDLNTDLNFVLSIPAATDATGNPFQINMNIPSGNTTYNQNVDMTGVTFDLTQSDSLNYNAIDIEYQVEVVGTSTPVYFNSSSSVSLTYGLNNLTFGMREGYFGNEIFDFADFAVEFPSSDGLTDIFGGAFTLNDPTFIMNFESTAGIPLGLDLELLGKKNTGETETVNVTNFIVQPATAPGTSVKSQLVIDNVSYPSIVDLIGLFPDSVLGSAGIVLNPQGVTHDNFLDPNSGLTVGFEVNIPLDITAEDLRFSDLFGFGGIGLDPDTTDLEFVKLILELENQFPFDAELQFVLFELQDSLVPIDTVVAQALTAAPVDANGNVIAPVNQTETIEFIGEEMNKLQRADSISINASMSTFNNGPVKLYENYKIHLVIRTEAKINHTFYTNP